MKFKIFGHKSEALFDYWTLGHVSLYYIVTRVLLMDLALDEAILIVLLFSFSWEFIEKGLEKNHQWFSKYIKGVECPANRWFGDPVANFIGFALAFF